jgi:exodeoxyribonuclease VII small subunit
MSNTRKSSNTSASNGAREKVSVNTGSGAAQDPLAFEEALGRLDETVAALEGGQLPLEDALRLYEEGVRMAQRCQQMLDTAELRVQQLRTATESDGDKSSSNVFILESFELDSE